MQQYESIQTEVEIIVSSDNTLKQKLIYSQSNLEEICAHHRSEIRHQYRKNKSKQH